MQSEFSSPFAKPSSQSSPCNRITHKYVHKSAHANLAIQKSAGEALRGRINKDNHLREHNLTASTLLHTRPQSRQFVKAEG